MPRIGLRTRVAGWRKLIAAAKVHEMELPQIGPFIAALEESLEDVTATQTRRATLQRLEREAGRELKAETASGTEMALRLKFFVRACFGRKDERLGDFGMKVLGRPQKKPPSERKVNGSPGYH
jgi:hypothetical protein